MSLTPPVISLPDSAAASHLRMLSRRLPLFFWATDLRLNITSHWGRTFRQRKGPPPSAVGHIAAEYFQCKNPSQAPLKQHFDALRGISSTFECRLRSRIFDMTIEPLLDNHNEIVGCLGMALDITERKKTEQRMVHQASHDGLTGLFNYRAFFECLEREALRSARSGGSFSLMLVDLNNLKSINDRLGHLVGNRALKRTARVLLESCRASDLVARFGGDEFAILLIDSDESLASQIASRIDKILSEDPQFPPISVSSGFAIYPQEATSPQQLFELADQRLYRSKHVSRLQTAATAPEFSLGRLR